MYYHWCCNCIVSQYIMLEFNVCYCYPYCSHLLLLSFTYWHVDIVDELTYWFCLQLICWELTCWRCWHFVNDVLTLVMCCQLAYWRCWCDDNWPVVVQVLMLLTSTLTLLACWYCWCVDSWYFEAVDILIFDAIWQLTVDALATKTKLISHIS